MTILSIVCSKLLCTNAHLGRRVAAHHFKVYICGSRNGIAILDSDKTLICLRNALHFIGSPIRQKGRSFFLKTNHLFRYEIMEEMASCINDSQWRIGAFFTNSFANKKKFHSRKKKINFGLNQQPDCAVILNADRKSSVILEADRSQIPIASLVDSTIPWESHKRITYPIPANDPIQFVYLFRHSITKTVILERPIILKMKVDRPRALRHFTLNTGKSAGIRPYSSTSSSSPKGKNKSTLFFFSLTMLMATSAILFVLNRYDVPGATELQKELASVLVVWVLCLFQSLYGIFVGGRCATLGGVDQEWTRSSAEETSTVGKPLLMESGDWDSLEPIGEIPPLSPGRGMVGPSEPTQAGLPASEPSQPSSSTQEAGRPASDSGPSPTFETVGDPRDPAPTYKRVPAPTYNYPPDLRSLTKMEEKQLKSALELEKSISQELRNIAIENGENFDSETSEDLVEAALNWKNSWNPEKLNTVLNSLQFCKAK
uniref:Ribosomal protein S2 n=1 Tax=Ferrocalamus rimosivaginus TaxID=591214 RepID=H6D9Q1_9POAL|nr:ribosomal protein S2 [Ferrocalamus rimosivaginus]AEX98087.1 ribosomal protein S2 [Ferrocalamus rimosivaginus]